MSLDDDISNAEAVRRQHEADLATLRAEYEEQALIDSPEAHEHRWENRWRQQETENPEPVYYRHPIPDDRLYAVSGEIPDQAVRDAAEPPWVPL